MIAPLLALLNISYNPKGENAEAYGIGTCWQEAMAQ